MFYLLYIFHSSEAKALGAVNWILHVYKYDFI